MLLFHKCPWVQSSLLRIINLGSLPTAILPLDSLTILISLTNIVLGFISIPNLFLLAIKLLFGWSELISQLGRSPISSFPRRGNLYWLIA
uniref:Uncharacterized protein n=1 Tax=Rhizophora mucronata TaxID=61149 RepID=A0A2P2P368_RHIMU